MYFNYRSPLRSKYCVTDRVLANNIRICLEHTLRDRFFNSGQKKDFASFSELLNIFKKHRPPTAICLIERAADNLFNFQAVIKKRGFASFDELLKYCGQFSIFQQ